MTAISCSNPVLPWSVSAEVERRFRRILRVNLIVFLVVGILMPMLPVTRIERPVEALLPPRVAQLVLEKRPVPPAPEPGPAVSEPKPLPKKPEKPPQPVVKKPRKSVIATPQPEKPRPTARQQAQQSGLLALKDTLADLRENTVSASLKETRALARGGADSRKTERAILTAGTTRGSGGIQTANLSRNTGGSALAARTTTRVHSPVGDDSPARVGGKGRSDRLAGRSIEEIQMVFDRNKGAIYSVYNRALRNDPTLKGKVVLQLTIAPSGKVTVCRLVSSELNDPELGRKISQRVKLFDFGAKDVETVTITYPIDFLPA